MVSRYCLIGTDRSKKLNRILKYGTVVHRNLLKYFFYRFSEAKRKKILENVSQKRSALTGSTSGKDQRKKQKDVYIVNKTKWYLPATPKEILTLQSMILDGNDMENKHRIIQHVIR